MVVHGIGRGGVGGWAVRLGAGQGGHTSQAWQSLQALGTMAAGSHATVRLQAAGKRGESKVTLGLMWHSTWVQQAHYLRRDMEVSQTIRTWKIRKTFYKYIKKKVAS